MGLVVNTAPAEEPVTRAEAALFMRYTGSLQNDVIDALIVAARKYVEAWTNKTLVTTTYEYYTDDLYDEIILPTGTVSSITSIQYQDSTDTQQTLSSTLYKLDNKSIQNKVYRDPLETFPEALVQPNAVKIVFVAGFGAASAVPEDFKTAIKIMVAQMFEHREGVQENDLKENPTIKQLLNIGADYRF
jgi:uncharacterized phiE125 gp8 family phage protein